MNDMSTTGAEHTGSTCTLQLAPFQGPLDLLLHLVRTEEIDVRDIPILEVARQCDEYLALMADVDLETAGDHLVMVSTLVHLKSRRLLPGSTLEEPQEVESVDLNSELRQAWALGIRRAAEQLQEREAQMELVFTRPADNISEYAGEQWIEADLITLLNAFQSILRRLGDNAAAQCVSRERMTLVDRIHWLLERLNREARIHFRSLFAGLGDRMSCILTFLALLEVMRLQLVRAYESHHQEDILIVLIEAGPSSRASSLNLTDA